MKIINQDTKIGFQGESYSREIKFEVSNDLLDCDIYFEFEKPDGNSYVSERINPQANYLIPLTLLDQVGFLKVQMVAYRGGDFVKKSEIQTFYISKSLNAVESLLTDEGNRGFVEEIIDISKKLGASLSVDENGIIYLLNKDGEIVSQIDLPTEKIIKNVYYEESSNSLVFEFENANTVYVPMATSIDKETNIEVNKLNAYGDSKIGLFGKTTSGSTRPLNTGSRKSLQVNGSAKVRSLEVGFTKEVDENGNEIVYSSTSASGGELKVYGTTDFYEYVRIRNSAKIDGALQVGGEFKIGGTFNVNGYDVENVSSIEVDQTSKLLGDTFSDKFKPYTDKVGKLGSDTKRFAYGYIGEVIFDNHKEELQGCEFNVENADGSTYGFTYNTDGYYHNTNTGVNNSYCLSKVLITNPNSIPVVVEFDCYQSSEDEYDYALISTLNGTLENSNYADDENVYINFKGFEGSMRVPYIVPTGTSFVYVKYKKDSSGNSGEDKFKFKPYTQSTGTTNIRDTTIGLRNEEVNEEISTSLIGTWVGPVVNHRGTYNCVATDNYGNKITKIEWDFVEDNDWVRCYNETGKPVYYYRNGYYGIEVGIYYNGSWIESKHSSLREMYKITFQEENLDLLEPMNSLSRKVEDIMLSIKSNKVIKLASDKGVQISNKLGVVSFAITKEGKAYYQGSELATKDDLGNIEALLDRLNGEV